MSQPFRILTILGVLLALGCVSVVAAAFGSEGTEGDNSVIPNEAQPAVDLATADLAGRLGMDASDLGVAAVEARTWPDTSLGCPEPDRLYAQVLVDGFRIVLSVDDTAYVYHSGPGRVVFCATDIG